MGFETVESIINHPIIGAIWETHVVMQVMKHFQALGKNRPLWFWRTIHGAEVDLLIEQGGRFVAVESKFSENPDIKALKGIKALEKFYGEDSVTVGFIASRTASPYPLSKKVQAISGSHIDQHI
jgi:predicted AAA+ superfamily ATPase